MNYGPSGMFGSIVVDDGAILADLTGADAADIAKAKAVLASGGMVVSDDRYVTDGKATISMLDYSALMTEGKSMVNMDDLAAKAPKITLPAYLLTTGNRAAGTVMSTAAATSAHLQLVNSGILVATTRTPTQAEEDHFNQAMSELGTNGFVQHPIEYTRDSMLYIIMGAAGADHARRRRHRHRAGSGRRAGGPVHPRGGRARHPDCGAGCR